MRISDDRYNRDLRRHTLAMRLIRHQARTETITRWTGLSAFRVRALFRAYARDSEDAPPPARHRGSAPRKLSFFYKTPQHELEALALAICCDIEGTFPKDAVADAARTFPAVETGEKICNAYDAFLHAFPAPQITLEHAILLVLALASRQELSLGACQRCNGLVIANRLDLQGKLCVYCREDSSPSPRFRPAPDPQDPDVA